MNRPLISYVITAYNSEKFIEQAIDCAFNQTYNPLEIVVSDDCSTDNTYALIQRKIKEYHGPHKIVVNRNERNMGISQHMSKVYIELAQGEIIVAAHADDISKPERVMQSYEFLKNHQDVNAVSYSIDTVNQNGDLIKSCSDFKNTDIHYYGIIDGLTLGNIPAPSRAFYKEVMTTFGWLNEDCPTEDELITFRAQLMKKKNAYLKEVLVYYRKHEGSSSNIVNFDKFPLSKIYKQLETDAQKAVELGFITTQDKNDIMLNIAKGHKIRQCYRDYLVKPRFSTIIKIMFKNIPLRNKLIFLKHHFSGDKGN